MDLRSGVPYSIRKNGWLSIYPPQDGDLKCEVAIVGGGISGALIAHQLAKNGASVVVIDRRNIGEGSTAASTSLLQYETDAEMVELAERYDVGIATRAFRAGLEAIDALQSIIAGLDDDCTLQRRPSLYLAKTDRDARRLRDELTLRQQAGFHCVWWSAEQISERSPFRAPGAIFSQGDAEVDAYRLTHRVMAQAVAWGACVFDRTELLRVAKEDDDKFVRLTTSRGEIQAEKIVYATGYESGAYLPRPIGRLRSTYALVTEPTAAVEQIPERALVWETARPYFYLRTTPDNRIIMGGGDTAFATDHRRDRLVAKKTQQLEKQLRQFFPDAGIETACAWAGTFGESPDGLPVIGSPREMPHAYFALGYGGNGITFSMLAARIITDLFLGRPNADSELFGFSRVS